MPLYEYECQDCGRRVEKIKAYSAPPETVCPHCGGKLEQRLSAPSVQFKGSGWYINDYAKGGSKKKGASGDGKDSGTADVSAAAEKPAGDGAGSGKAAAKPAGESSSGGKTESAATPKSSSATAKTE